MSADEVHVVVGPAAVVPVARGAVRGKRLFDVLTSTAGVIVLAPLLAVIWIGVRLTSNGPAIYRGWRVGLDGRDFEIMKFRTMIDEPTTQLTTALGDPRITPFGRWLRRHKLDELPQLLNVMRGDMSIVGPRPEFRTWVDLYDLRELATLSVRPGITDFSSLEFIRLDELIGTAHADARYLDSAFPRKNALRLRYVEEMCWATDLRLIRQTAVHVLWKK